MKAVIMREAGSADVLDYLADRPEPVASRGHVVVAVAAAGVNFMDIGVRQGMAWTDMPNPKVLGVEGAGRVIATGDGVTDFAVGDRVAWVYAPGSYSERIAIPSDALVPVPDTIDDRTALP